MTAPDTLARAVEADLLDGWGTADVAARHPADPARVRALLAQWRHTGKLDRLARQARARWAAERGRAAA